jgi:apolipoprotein N-acyltransferase
VSRSSLIESKLAQPASKSKKALYAGLAGLGVIVVFISSCALLFLHSEVAKEIVELASTSIMAFMALAVTLITGQSAFDWKAVSALQHIDEDSNEDQHIESNQPLAPEVNIYRRDPKDYLLEHDTTI